MARILAVDDDRSFRRALARTLSELGFDVVEAEDGVFAQEALGRATFDLVITDLEMPRADGFEVIRAVRAARIPVVMLTGNSRAVDAVTALRAGATDFLMKPYHPDELASVVRAAIERGDDERPTNRPQAALLGESDGLRDLLARVEAVGRGDSAVSFAGENGSGIEAFARLVHGLSKRAAEPFVRVGCLGCNDGTLLAAVERARGGTLFLDDVSCLDRSVQATVRRVVKNGDVRVVAATERVLAPLVDAESFDDELAQMLADVTLTMPPLRTRPEDVPILVRHFLDDANRRHGRSVALGDAQIGALQAYRFPGNVGELQTMVDRLVRFGEDAKVEAAPRVSLSMFDGTRREVSVLAMPSFDSTAAFFTATETGIIRHFARDAVAAISREESCAAGGPRVRVHLRSGTSFEGSLDGPVAEVLADASRALSLVAPDARHLVAKSHVAWVEEIP